LLRAGELILSNSATICVPKILKINGCIHDGFLAFPGLEQHLNKHYLYHYFNFIAPAVREEFKQGVTQVNLNTAIVADFGIPVPPLQEQQRIAAILDKADAIRRKQEQAFLLSEELLRSTFLDMFGDPATNPKEWDFAPLSRFIRADDKINYGVVQPGDDYPGGVPVVRVGDFSGRFVNIESLKRVSPSIDEMHRRSRLVGDEVLLACVGSIGRVALADERLRGFNTVRAIARIRCGDRLDRAFLSQYLELPWVQQYFTKETRTVSQPTLNISHIEQTPVYIVPVEKQREFSRLYERIDQNVRSWRAVIEEHGTLFVTMLQRAFRGEL
jgi:type I restriction enzyme S subunit